MRAVLVTGLALLVGCAPLVVPVNYRPIRGTVGREMTAGQVQPCLSPTVLAPAKIDEGDLPPGLALAPDGIIRGTPASAGSWHAMFRSARLRCEDQVHGDMWQTLHFEIAKKKLPGPETN
jgi:hypothetical protein